MLFSLMPAYAAPLDIAAAAAMPPAGLIFRRCLLRADYDAFADLLMPMPFFTLTPYYA